MEMPIMSVIDRVMSVIDRGLRSARRPITVFVVFTMLSACTTPSTLPDPLAAGWKGTSVCEQLNDDSEHRILRCTFKPGGMSAIIMTLISATLWKVAGCE